MRKGARQRRFALARLCVFTKPGGGSAGGATRKHAGAAALEQGVHRAPEGHPQSIYCARPYMPSDKMHPDMSETQEAKQTGNHQSEGDQGCPVDMHGGRRCGRPIYNPPPGIDDTPVCLMHSRDPSKDDGKFQTEFEHILKEAGTGTADLRFFVFPSANYGMREFTAECLFAWAKFAQGALFYQAKFAQRADFTGATFMKDSSFWQATFAQDAEFGGAKFPKGAEFTEATFIGNARFSRASFGGRATFWKARFMRQALFGGVTFTENAEFRDASISKDAVFNEATFRGQASFVLAAFMGVAAFYRTTFRLDADFTMAIFAQRAEFGFAAFEGPVIFRETRFREDNTLSPGPVFSNARFDKPAAVAFFRTFLGQAIFRNCDMSMFVLSDVRWRERSTNGKRMLFEEVADPGDAALGAILAQGKASDERNYALIAELYQQLKKNYDDKRDYWTAGDFHYGEMEMKRLASPRLTWLVWLEAWLAGRLSLREPGEW